MAKNFVQDGNVLDMIAPSGGVVSGTGYLIGSIFGVAIVTAAQTETFALQTTGVWNLPTASGAGTDWTAGTKVYWDNTAKNVTKTSSGNTFIGFGLAAKATADTAANIRLQLVG
jgi:predicted RecA/RadA family phage recombinase